MKQFCFAFGLTLLCLVNGAVPTVSGGQIKLAADEPKDKKQEVSESTTRVPGANVNTVADWSKGSSLSEGVQFLLASTWIALLGAIPLILRRVSDKPVTRTEQMLAGILWVTLFGGLWLFTNIILFQSPHFGGEIRPLTMVECIYLMSQVITTVGYGDITPAKPRGQVFVGLYVLGALFVISMLVGQLMAHLGKVAQEYEKAFTETAEPGRTSSAEHLENLHFIAGKPPKPDRKPLIKSMLIFAVIDFIFVMFFYNWPGEDKTLLQCFYMSVITLSTVGFGAFTPITEGGMIFGAFAMLFGSAALVNVIGNFGELMVRQQQYEQFDPSSCEQAFEHLEETVKGSKVSEVDFVRFALVSQGIVSQEEIDKVSKAFQHLTPGTDNTININAIKSSLVNSMKEP